MNQQSVLKTVFSFIVKLIKIFFVFPWALGMALAAVALTYEFTVQLSAFAEYEVFPLPYILSQLCMIGMAVFFSLLISKLLFGKKMEKLPAGKLAMLLVAFSFAGAGFSVMDEYMTDEFPIHYYPPYISDWQAQSVNETIDCDYSKDTIMLSGSFNVINNSFRNSNCLEFVTEPGLTSSFRAEIVYKGNPAEIYIFQEEYLMKEYGEYGFSVNIWPQNYDYELSPQDRAYMYKHGINLEYSEPLVVEKIIIYTPYPEKFDISDMWFQS